jgi:hypothetical protein
MIRRTLAAQAVVLSCLMLLVADVYAHKRVEQAGGVNVWGYRGPAARQRKPGDVRLLLVGGTRAFGYGASADGTISHRVEWDLNVNGDRPFTVINAARSGATAADYAGIISQYAALQSDFIVIHDDLGRAATRPRRSRVAALARGYTPVLPLVIEEKGMAWRFGSVAAAYEGQAPSGSLAARVAGATLQVLGRALRELESPRAPAVPAGHTAAMLAAIDTALQHSLAVLVVVDPATTEVTAGNGKALKAAIEQRADRGKVRFLDLAAVPGIDNADSTLDGYSYSALGRQRVALAMLPAVADLVRNSRAH